MHNNIQFMDYLFAIGVLPEDVCATKNKVHSKIYKFINYHCLKMYYFYSNNFPGICFTITKLQSLKICLIFKLSFCT